MLPPYHCLDDTIALLRLGNQLSELVGDSLCALPIGCTYVDLETCALVGLVDDDRRCVTAQQGCGGLHCLDNTVDSHSRSSPSLSMTNRSCRAMN